MMKKITLIFIISIVIVSCQREFDYSQQLGETKANVICFLEANKPINLHLSYNKFAFELYQNNDLFSIKNADVYIYEENILIEKLKYKDTLNESGWYSGKFIVQKNKHYQLKIIIPNYNDTIYSETFIPEPVHIDSIFFSSIQQTDDEIEIPTKIIFSDPSFQKNYYNLITEKKDIVNNSYRYSNCYYKSQDPVFEMKQNGQFYYTQNIVNKKGIFSDSLFNGQQYALNITYLPQDIQFKSINYMILQTISKEYFMFFKYSFLQYKNSSNPLTEPVQIYSNIKNGTGIFAGYSSYSDTITITKEMLQLKKTN